MLTKLKRGNLQILVFRIMYMFGLWKSDPAVLLKSIYERKYKEEIEKYKQPKITQASQNLSISNLELVRSRDIK